MLSAGMILSPQFLRRFVQFPSFLSNIHNLSHYRSVLCIFTYLCLSCEQSCGYESLFQNLDHYESLSGPYLSENKDKLSIGSKELNTKGRERETNRQSDYLRNIKHKYINIQIFLFIFSMNFGPVRATINRP